jgi:hypothetical protein
LQNVVPSWVPTFERVDVSRLGTVGLLSQGLEYPRDSLTLLEDLLQVSGGVSDSITHVGMQRVEDTTLSDWLEEIDRMTKDVMTYPTGEVPKVAVWKALMGKKKPDGMTVEACIMVWREIRGRRLRGQVAKIPLVELEKYINSKEPKLGLRAISKGPSSLRLYM